MVAVVGNPNTGKTTLFNCLTGLRQRVGNYPGVTVEKKLGTILHLGEKASALDLPGTYSLAASSADERIVVDVLGGHMPGMNKPDLVVCVIDATNLLRNLFLFAQIADLGLPMVIALNMWDSANKMGVTIDTAELSRRLGVPVVATSGVRGEGIDLLRQAIFTALKTKPIPQTVIWPEKLKLCFEFLKNRIEIDAGELLSDAEVRRVLFDTDSAIAERIGWDAKLRRKHVETARSQILSAGYNPSACEPFVIYDHLSRQLEGIFRDANHADKYPTSETIDKLLTHRFWGLVVFAAMMYLVFQAIYTGAGPIMSLIESVTSWVAESVGAHLTGMPIVHSLVVDGIISGAGGVLVFLPQILILFFFISLLEDVGYMARAAFLMDKMFSWCGLNGKSFVPLLSSYACAIPGVMATRTIEDPKARLVTILIAPLMSCSARLPVYVLLIGAFIEPRYGPVWAGTTLFAMHFIGLLVALPIAFFLTRFVFKVKRQAFVLEMPPYRTPKLWNVFWRVFEAGKAFLLRAGTVILALSIVIWALLYFPRPAEVEEKAKSAFVTEKSATQDPADVSVLAELEKPDSDLAQEFDHHLAGAYVEQSYMGQFGKFVQPVFAYAGFDWKITVGVLASFPAREVIISTLGIIYNLGGDEDEESEGLRETMSAQLWKEGPLTGQPVFTLPVVLSIMVFFAFCMQCGATMAVIAKESSWGWSLLSFAYMTTLAWLASVATYQIASRIFLT